VRVAKIVGVSATTFVNLPLHKKRVFSYSRTGMVRLILYLHQAVAKAY